MTMRTTMTRMWSYYVDCYVDGGERSQAEHKRLQRKRCAKCMKMLLLLLILIIAGVGQRRIYHACDDPGDD